MGKCVVGACSRFAPLVCKQKVIKVIKVVKVIKMIEDENFYYKQAEAVKNQLQDANKIPLLGSPKQVAWAERIRNQALESIAIQVCEKEITIDQAWSFLSNPSSSWWIDNRDKWIDLNYKGVY